MNNISRFVFIFAAVIITSGCLSPGTQAQPRKGFIDENIQDFSSFTLSNGMPVIMKKNDSNRIRSLQIVLRGHVMLTPADKAGIESLTLMTMSKSSRNYSADVVRKRLHETSSSISADYAHFDYSSFRLNTLDKHFDTVFPVFADCFTSPSFNEKAFSESRIDLLRSIQQQSADSYAKAVKALHERIFKGHPYEAVFYGTESSLKSLQPGMIREYHERTFSADRMFIVAVGNYNRDELRKQLENAFGSIESKGIEISDPPPFPVRQESIAVVEEYEKSPGIAYIRADFTIPRRSDRDYPALLIASAMLDDLLFEIVRIRHGASYGAWVYPFGFKANYCSLVIYKTNNPAGVKPWIDEAINTLAEGKSLGAKVSVSAEGKGGLGGETTPELESTSLVPISESLRFYKSQAINRFFLSQQTNQEIADQIAYSRIFTGQADDYLYLTQRINSVTADDIKRVVKTYIRDQKKAWVILGGPDLIQDIRPEMYTVSD